AAVVGDVDAIAIVRLARKGQLRARDRDITLEIDAPPRVTCTRRGLPEGRHMPVVCETGAVVGCGSARPRWIANTEGPLSAQRCRAVRPLETRVGTRFHRRRLASDVGR